LPSVPLGQFDLPAAPYDARSVQEIRIAHSKEAYRVIYVTKLADCIYVLHAFHKKAKTGIETPKEEIDLAKKGYKELVQSLRRS
jgi:phage-related protein